jgi:hypothetical protein
VAIKTLYTYCEQVGRRGNDYEKKRNIKAGNIYPIVMLLYASYYGGN